MGEQDIIAGIKNGDQQVFKALVDEYQPMVLNLCYRFVNDEDTAKDLTQDVFIEIFESIHKFRGDSKLVTWLYRTAVNKSLNYVKRSKRMKLMDSVETFFKGSAESSDHSFDADKNITNAERSAHLYQAINSLSKNQRIAFSMHNIDGISYAEIAEVMQLSLSSVESLIHRAKVNLQKRLIDFYKKNME